MKKTVFCLVMVLMFCLGITACQQADTDIWSMATYKQDTEFGDGEKKLTVEVIAQDKSVNFAINSDKETVGEALVEHNLISGENGAYGLYVKVVNGIVADYDKNQSFWAFTKNGEQMSNGVDTTEFSDGEHYELVYTSIK